LTNLETATQKLLQIILIGQPELTALLNQRNLRQLNQRITARFHLTPLRQRDTSTYVRHRLRVAGGSSALFSPAAVRTVYRLSSGIPRLINILCDRALLAAYAQGARRVTPAMVRRAASDVRGRSSGPWAIWTLLWRPTLAALGIVALLGGILTASDRAGLPGTPPAAAVPAPEVRSVSPVAHDALAGGASLDVAGARAAFASRPVRAAGRDALGGVMDAIRQHRAPSGRPEQQSMPPPRIR
jgi:general secretion pathway protein A